VDGEAMFAVVGPNGLCLLLRLLTQAEAETLARTLNEYLDEETVADMLTTGASRPCGCAR
jgi:hypothetical protein